MGTFKKEKRGAVLRGGFDVVLNNPRNAVDFVDNFPTDGLEETPRKFVRLGGHHVQAGHSSQNADILINLEFPCTPTATAQTSVSKVPCGGFLRIKLC